MPLPNKKGGARKCCEAHPGRSKGQHQRVIVTAVGPVGVRRTYFSCAACKQGEFGADRVLGIDGYLTAGASRMACLAGVQQSFACAEQLLDELAGWQLDDETIRRVCHQTAQRAHAEREERTTAAVFAKAQGDHEVQIDAGKVNTLEGWRDVKAAIFARRQRGAPATTAEWDTRDLPKPSARAVIAAIEEVSQFGERCAAEARRLQLPDAARVSVLGDGAEWIWNLQQRHFANADGLLDVFHARGHVADGAKGVFGEGKDETKKQTERGQQRLLEDGYGGVTEWIGEVASQIPVGGDGAALGSMLNYFAGHQERLNYALRLCRGQSIGSGLVEGTIKQMINLRMKRTGARWKLKHVGPFVELRALTAGPEWLAFWTPN